VSQIENLAAINYTVRQIAMYLKVSINELYREYNNKDSEFRRHFDTGKLFSQAKIDMQIVKSAEGGNATAMQMYEKTRAARHFENERDNLIYGDR
jgi:hypothetical protein